MRGVDEGPYVIYSEIVKHNPTVLQLPASSSSLTTKATGEKKTGHLPNREEHQNRYLWKITLRFNTTSKLFTF
ncbi:uncharacterized protein K444DRAFT_326556 [Hyaloscypha bicolor E]|uniref:Uncharacterized protein n=1 Tax=Hyaloscypha bicolor E TaxID=1095630 RepID=A0A2J6TL41_9HELO|nr:uncharacterized protein K444DRAFT_326556 [Hyaloscypha bicolor E]PMD63712.1 hypothetical protein K444DRAFT_326556 [Hyaloscypha bicolor E]